MAMDDIKDAMSRQRGDNPPKIEFEADNRDLNKRPDNPRLYDQRLH